VTGPRYIPPENLNGGNFHKRRKEDSAGRKKGKEKVHEDMMSKVLFDF